MNDLQKLKLDIKKIEQEKALSSAIDCIIGQGDVKTTVVEKLKSRFPKLTEDECSETYHQARFVILENQAGEIADQVGVHIHRYEYIIQIASQFGLDSEKLRAMKAKERIMALQTEILKALLFDSNLQESPYDLSLLTEDEVNELFNYYRMVKGLI